MEGSGGNVSGERRRRRRPEEAERASLAGAGGGGGGAGDSGGGEVFSLRAPFQGDEGGGRDGAYGVVAARVLRVLHGPLRVGDAPAGRHRGVVVRGGPEVAGRGSGRGQGGICRGPAGGVRRRGRDVPEIRAGAAGDLRRGELRRAGRRGVQGRPDRTPHSRRGGPHLG